MNSLAYIARLEPLGSGNLPNNNIILTQQERNQHHYAIKNVANVLDFHEVTKRGEAVNIYCDDS